MKAAREAKLRTSWNAPDSDYEEALDRFIRGCLGDAAFVEEVERFVAPLVEPGRSNALAQTLLKLAAPGVPDLYQGTELWDLSLVDPDNRRPVDYARRREALASLEGATLEEIRAGADAGLPKLWLIRQALDLRRRRTDALGAGATYAPSAAVGGRAAHVFAFRRGEAVLAVTPRLVLRLARTGGWSGTALPVPVGALAQRARRPGVPGRDARPPGRAARAVSRRPPGAGLVSEVAVWAPRAERVALALEHGREPMRADAGGWWRSTTRLPAGTDYRFVLDDGDPLPDPRSPWQPAGVHGPSRTVDHAAFTWTDGGWRPPQLEMGVIYELHVGTFTPGGTFDDAIERLPDLVALGVTHVELMPVAEFSGTRGWGYDGVDLFAPHHAYGGPDGLKRLVDAAHRQGLAVLLDVVYNHLGPEGNVLDRYGPYFTDRYRTPWGAAVNFDDHGSVEVRRFVVDNACMWLRDYHLDGLRLDATHAIFDRSAIHILEQLRGAVAELGRTLGRRLVVIAECDLDDPRLVRAPSAGGYGLDAAWADDVHHALHVSLTGERSGYYADFVPMRSLATALRSPYLFTGGPSSYRGRLHGRSPGTLSGSRFVAALQNHDQVGNRALGERLSALVSVDRLLVGAALLVMAPYVPLIFAGEEWGASTPFLYFTDHADPGLGEAVRQGRRAEFAAFGWRPEEIPDPQDERTFIASRLRWDEREEGEHARILRWWRDLLALRRATGALHDGRRDRVRAVADDRGTLVLRRAAVTVAANLGADQVRLREPGRLLLASAVSVGRRGAHLVLPPDTVAILEQPA